MIECRKNNCSKQDQLEEHHIVPKFMAEVKSETGKVVRLCKKHHDILHKMMLKWIWQFVTKQNRTYCKEEIKRKTDWFLNIEKKM